MTSYRQHRERHVVVIGEAVQRRPFAAGTQQIQAFYIMDLPGMDAALEWANRLPTYGCVEVRELLQL